jgi:UDP-glucose 4-epimerase
VRQVLDTAAEVVGRPVPQSMAPRRPGDPPQLVADASSARKRLGFAPARSDLRVLLEDALRSRR